MPNGTSGDNNFHPQLIGSRVREHRLKLGIPTDEAAKSIGVTPDVLTEIETGKRDATLPQLEVMAIILNRSITDFWTEKPPEEEREYPTLEVITLRQRIIGALLRQARTEAGYTEEEVAEKAGLSAEQIREYELGESDIPLSNLTKLSNQYNVALTHFLETGIAITDQSLNEKLTTLEQIVQFSKLPPDMREFLANPANLLYLNIAFRLSELSVDTLRGLAEGLLEVTY